MTKSLKPKDVESVLLGVLADGIASSGFIQYKSKQYIKVVDEVLLFIQPFFNKNDTYIWYSAYPLIQNDINLGMGVIANRFPLEEGSLVISDVDNLSSLEESLLQGLSVAISFLEKNLL